MTHSPQELAGRVAIVTGASSGLGRATAERLAASGAAVALLARSGQDLERVRDGITGQQVLIDKGDRHRNERLRWPHAPGFAVALGDRNCVRARSRR